MSKPDIDGGAFIKGWHRDKLPKGMITGGKGDDLFEAPAKRRKKTKKQGS